MDGSPVAPDLLLARGQAFGQRGHVSDLARAHVLALDWLERGEPSAVYTLGVGRPFSRSGIGGRAAPWKPT